MKDKLRELAERWKRYDSLRMCANELLTILDAEGDGGAVIPDELFAWLTARDLVPDLDEDGSFDMHLLIEALNEHENELQATHPTRSSVVSDEDVQSSSDVFDAIAMSPDCYSTNVPMRAALEHFAKGERHEH